MKSDEEKVRVSNPVLCLIGFHLRRSLRHQRAVLRFSAWDGAPRGWWVEWSCPVIGGAPMRAAFAVVLVLGAAALTHAQPPREAPKDAPPRYGVNARAKAYPQETPKAALKSALLAVEKADYSYLVA